MKQLKKVWCMILTMTIVLSLLSHGIKGESMRDDAPEVWGKSFEELVDNLEICGYDVFVSFEKHANFSLTEDKINPQKEKGYDELYDKFHYKWSSINQNVATFHSMIEQKQSGCIIFTYGPLEREAMFNIKPGKTTIICEISDDEGHKKTLRKEITVLENSPIKTAYLGTNQIRNVNQWEETIYSNEPMNNLQPRFTTQSGWKLKNVEIETINKSQSYVIAHFKHLEYSREYTFYYYIERFTEHRLNLKKIEKSAYLCTRTRERVCCAFRWVSHKYQLKDFQNFKELEKKIKEETGFSDQTLKIQNGILIYKETPEHELCAICKSSAEYEHFQVTGQPTVLVKKNPIRSIKLGNKSVKIDGVKKKTIVLKKKDCLKQKKIPMKMKLKKGWIVEEAVAKLQGEKNTRKTLRWKKGKKYVVTVKLRNSSKAQHFVVKFTVKMK
ncbi:MAG: hypothetical protein K6G64_03910 [Eubacterium sp.]|nr:hypothetical protein [Eubacterium sp.]